jgi:hypothetical protein
MELTQSELEEHCKCYTVLPYPYGCYLAVGCRKYTSNSMTEHDDCPYGMELINMEYG